MWAYDFVCDPGADGRSLKCLTIIDEFTREYLAIDVAGGIRPGRVVEVLTQLVSLHGAPRYLRSDNGPEFVARAILRWLQPARSRLLTSIRASCGRKAPTNRSTGAARPTPLPAEVPQSGGREGEHRSLAPALQRGPAALSLGYLAPAEFKAKYLAGSIDEGARARCRLALTSGRTKNH